MSRIGKLPITLPSDAKAELQGQTLTIQGKLGTLSLGLLSEVVVTIENGVITVLPREDNTKCRSMWGLTRTLVNNLVVGVSQGYDTILDISGVGYRAAINEKILALSVGFSHPILFAFPAGVDIKCPKPTQIVVSGISKQKVNYVAAVIRSFRPPEPYKGKGIRRNNEVVLRKEGKKK